MMSKVYKDAPDALDKVTKCYQKVNLLKASTVAPAAKPALGSVTSAAIEV